MCGIFGVIDTNEKIDEGRVLAARDILAHRGPDDAGIYFSPRHTERVIPSLACTEPVEVSSRARHTERVILSEVEGRSARDEGPFVALAHRRLSIIDLSPSGHQPMSTPDGRYTIVFNGEIYNYKDLSKQITVMNNSASHITDHSSLITDHSSLITDHSSLITDHSSLLTNSDTEVILNLYTKYGKDCLNMLRGMFSFAIWDEKEKTLFAARDRFGIKPFYYFYDKNPTAGEASFIFSSELKAIKHYKKNLTISKEGIDAFLRTGSVPAPLTIYNEVAALLPGNYIEVDYHPERVISSGDERRRISINKYWSFNNLFSSNSSLITHHSSLKKKYDADAKKKIRAALLDSVRAHMVSDVEVGAFLSGGIDSTAIVSLMRQVGQEKIKTVSVVFPGNKLDESKYARLAAKTYNTEHIEIPFYEKDLLDDFENIMTSMDQPTIDGINTYFVSKAAKQAGLKVVLSGLGGDELFGGYPSFNLIPKYQRIKNLPFAKMFMKAAAPLLKNKLPAKAIHYMKNPDEPNAEYKLIRGLFTDSELNSMGWNNTDHSSLITDHGGFATSRFYRDSSPITISELETTHYMRNQLLRDSDVFSMAHSLELRVPFVDHLLYAAVLPYLDSGFNKNFPKKMLVDAVGDIPLELINRPKMGFTFPFADWIMNGQLKDKMFDSIKNLNPDLNTCPPGRIYPFIFDLEKLHWSRLWTLFILSRYV